MTSKVEFTPPPAFSLPEGSEMGKDFDLVATFRQKDDGRLCIVKLGDYDMPGYDDNDGVGKSRPDMGGYVGEMTGQQMSGDE